MNSQNQNLYNSTQNNRQTNNNHQGIPVGKTGKIKNNNLNENFVNQTSNTKAKGHKNSNDVRKGEEIKNNFINNFTTNPAQVNINQIQFQNSMLNSSRYLFI